MHICVTPNRLIICLKLPRDWCSKFFSVFIGVRCDDPIIQWCNIATSSDHNVWYMMWWSLGSELRLALLSLPCTRHLSLIFFFTFLSQLLFSSDPPTLLGFQEEQVFSFSKLYNFNLPSWSGSLWEIIVTPSYMDSLECVQEWRCGSSVDWCSKLLFL